MSAAHAWARVVGDSRVGHDGDEEVEQQDGGGRAVEHVDHGRDDAVGRHVDRLEVQVAATIKR